MYHWWHVWASIIGRCTRGYMRAIWERALQPPDCCEPRAAVSLLKGIPTAPSIEILLVFPCCEWDVLRFWSFVLCSIVVDTFEQWKESKTIQFGQARFSISPPLLKFRALLWFNFESVTSNVSLCHLRIFIQYSSSCFFKMPTECAKSETESWRKVEAMKTYIFKVLRREDSNLNAIDGHANAANKTTREHHILEGTKIVVLKRVWVKFFARAVWRMMLYGTIAKHEWYDTRLFSQNVLFWRYLFSEVNESTQYVLYHNIFLLTGWPRFFCFFGHEDRYIFTSILVINQFKSSVSHPEWIKDMLLFLILLLCHYCFAFRGRHILFGPSVMRIRGIQHYPNGHIKQLVGKTVQIQREKNNIYDPNAIKVENKEGKCCGYIARTHAVLFSPILDSILSLSELSATPVEVECDVIRCDRLECDVQVSTTPLSSTPHWYVTL